MLILRALRNELLRDLLIHRADSRSLANMENI